MQPAAEFERALPCGLTEQGLRELVAANRSWRAVLRAVGSRSAHQGRQLRKACDELGIDYSHFTMRTWSDDQLRVALTTVRSWPELLDALGFAQNSGSARATVRKHATRLGLDTAALSDPAVAKRTDPFAAHPDLKHLRAAGAYLVAGACALAGYKVSWPLEPAVYDLLVDTGTIHRVQVKTTTYRVDGTWACKITHSASSERAWYTASEIDFFGIVDGDRDVYMIPVGVLDGLARIYVRRYEAYRLPRTWA
jgi:hypothetical protein